MRHYKMITIFEHQRRISDLETFRDILSQYYEQKALYGDEQNPEMKEYRKEINRQIQRINRIVGTADISPYLQSEYSNSHKGVNVFDNMFKLEQYRISYKEVIDLLDKVIGEYESENRNAFVRTVNPLFWFHQAILWFSHIPFGLIDLFGLEGRRMEKSPTGQSFKKIIQVAMLFILTIAVLYMFNLLDDVTGAFSYVVVTIKNTVDSTIVSLAQ